MKGFALVIKNFRAYGVCMGHGMWCKMAAFSIFQGQKVSSESRTYFLLF